MRLWSEGIPRDVQASVIGRLTRVPITGRREDAIALVTAETAKEFGDDWSGYAGAVLLGGLPAEIGLPRVVNPPNLEYLGTGDVIQLQPSGKVRVLYRRASEHNTILTTEQCNSLCLMCSQPPKVIDDSYRVNEILRLLELIDPETRELGLSGGEPTLLGDRFIEIIAKAKNVLPRTALHVLTNGRLFKDRALARKLGGVGHHDLMLGIPLYSDVDWRHDHVVQANGAYDETIAGFYNLAGAGVRIEIRVVLHRLTTDRLSNLAEFIARNFPFVEHVAFMGLEMFGFTPKNLSVLWIDPFDYQKKLETATRILARAGLHVSIYNHQLCTLPRSLWPFAVKSISDWKNVYLAECAGCGVRDVCGGFFQSATKRHSAHIQPLEPLGSAALDWLGNWWHSSPVATAAASSEVACESGETLTETSPTRRHLPIVDMSFEQVASLPL